MKPNREILKNIEAKAQLSFPTKVRINVENMPNNAKIIKNNFLLFFLSAMRPKNGAKTINNKLAVELAIPNNKVLVVSKNSVA